MPGRGMGERLADRPEPQQHPLPRRAERERAVAQHRLRRATWAEVTASPTPATTRRPERHQRLHQRQPGRGVGVVRPAHRHRGAAKPQTHLRRRGRQGEHRSTAPPTAARTWAAGRRPADRVHPAQGRARPRRRLPLPGHQRHRRPVRRRQGRRLEAGHRHRRLDQRSARCRPTADDAFGLQRPDRRPAAARARCMVATQISWWPDVVFFRSTDGGATWTRGLGLRRLAERGSTATTSTSPTAPWLTWNATPALPEQAPKLGWMTESRGDRPVRLRPHALRHRRHHLRHRQPHRLGHRRHGAHLGAGPGPGGDARSST